MNKNKLMPEITSPTMANLAKYLGRHRTGLYEMKKVKPKQFQLLWNGWLEYCKTK